MHPICLPTQYDPLKQQGGLVEALKFDNMNGKLKTINMEVFDQGTCNAKLLARLNENQMCKYMI